MKKGKPKKLLLLGDIHAPMHSEKAIKLVKKIAKVFKPDYCVQVGDLSDCYKASRFSKDPSRKTLLVEELEIAASVIEDIDSALPSKCVRVFTEGNHCARVNKYLVDNAAELYGMVKNPVEVKLKELGWKHVPYQSSYKIGDLTISHEFGRSGPLAHVQAMRDFGGCIAHGHNHAAGVAYGGLLNGKKMVSMSVGWLGDENLVADYLHKDRASRDWMLGCGVGYLMPNGVVYLNFLPFIDFKTVVEGRIVSL